jgi:hypothetical protein
MISHARLSGWVVLALATFFSSLLSAAETSRSPAVLPAAPSQELAIRLLALRDERFEKDYQVALIMPGETEFQALTVANAAQVTYFGPSTKKGRKSGVSRGNFSCGMKNMAGSFVDLASA